ncbi:DUF551 domain-containing protein [Enterobacter kobei]|uniref:DUF551 domain-containing protein n=1 Tax=Enterobacter cloacae complex TaxID=354276 RepID=UPI002002C33C|nr:DUF551 domain-containing protein [Enterobacter kobei]MCK7005883.1 DUF551 domain-containing protein [Enterobacter kobei]
MKTLTIGWLNKCHCGNRSHTVKTARGNNAGLWDDDAVECNSCGRGGVIQVCEGQARVLWETDEEMAEGKPMSTITKEFTKEQLTGIIEAVDDLNDELENDRKCHGMAGNKITEKWDYLNDRAAPPEVVKRLARIALASLEAEAVCVIDQSNLDYLKSGADADVWPASRKEMGDVLLYRTAPPAPAKAEPVAWLWSHRKHPSEVSLVRPEDDERAEGAHWSGWSCQALYAAPPAPVSVPDEVCWEDVPEEITEDDMALASAWAHGFNQCRAAMLKHSEPFIVTSDHRMMEMPQVEAINAVTAMLQGVEPVTTAYKLQDGWVACSERMPETAGNYWGWWSESKRQGPVWFIKSELQAQFQSSEITHWMPLPAAPQQEGKW